MAGHSDTPAVELRGWSKTFSGVTVLRGVNLDVQPGEIRGLLGQNGSGKSTLIKILAGYHTPDPGAGCQINGKSFTLPIHRDLQRRLGLSFVHQDLGLIGELSILDNMLVGRYGNRRGYPIIWANERRRIKSAFERFALHLDLDSRVDEFGDIERALIAIARAMLDVSEARANGILVLDEPTVYLPASDTYRLFDAMKEVASSGTAVLFVTHSVQEAKIVTDRISVLRSGELVSTVDTSLVTEDELITLIIGKEIGRIYPDKVATTGSESVLEVKELAGDDLNGVSFAVAPGQIVGLTGLIGSGFASVLYYLYGARMARHGWLRIGERTISARHMNPRLAIREGMALVPANRHRDGVVQDLTVLENLSQPMLGRYMRHGFLSESAARKAAAHILEDFQVVPRQLDNPMATLSGGNQQKTVLGKWLQGRPRILLLHEPTQGVDVGARKQIFSIVREAASAGAGVIIASSEHADLAHLCNEVHVFHQGRVGAVLRDEDVTEELVAAESLRSA